MSGSIVNQFKLNPQTAATTTLDDISAVSTSSTSSTVNTQASKEQISVYLEKHLYKPFLGQHAATNPGIYTPTLEIAGVIANNRAPQLKQEPFFLQLMILLGTGTNETFGSAGSKFCTGALVELATQFGVNHENYDRPSYKLLRKLVEFPELLLKSGMTAEAQLEAKAYLKILKQDLESIYYYAKGHLNNNDLRAREHCKQTLQTLFTQLNVCAPGLLASLAVIKGDLLNGGLHLLVAKYILEEISTYHAILLSSNAVNIPPQNSIHLLVKLVKIAQEYGYDVSAAYEISNIDDHFANRININKEHFKKYLQQKISIAAFANDIKTKIASEIENACAQLNISFTDELFIPYANKEQLEAHIIYTLKKFGVLGNDAIDHLPHTLVELKYGVADEAGLEPITHFKIANFRYHLLINLHALGLCTHRFTEEKPATIPGTTIYWLDCGTEYGVGLAMFIHRNSELKSVQRVNDLKFSIKHGSKELVRTCFRNSTQRNHAAILEYIASKRRDCLTAHDFQYACALAIKNKFLPVLQWLINSNYMYFADETHRQNTIKPILYLALTDITAALLQNKLVSSNAEISSMITNSELTTMLKTGPHEQVVDYILKYDLLVHDFRDAIIDAMLRGSSVPYSTKIICYLMQHNLTDYMTATIHHGIITPGLDLDLISGTHVLNQLAAYLIENNLLSRVNLPVLYHKATDLNLRNTIFEYAKSMDCIYISYKVWLNSTSAGDHDKIREHLLHEIVKPEKMYANTTHNHDLFGYCVYSKRGNNFDLLDKHLTSDTHSIIYYLFNYFNYIHDDDQLLLNLLRNAKNKPWGKIFIDSMQKSNTSSPLGVAVAKQNIECMVRLLALGIKRDATFKFIDRFNPMPISTKVQSSNNALLKDAFTNPLKYAINLLDWDVVQGLITRDTKFTKITSHFGLFKALVDATIDKYATEKAQCDHFLRDAAQYLQQNGFSIDTFMAEWNNDELYDRRLQILIDAKIYVPFTTPLNVDDTHLMHMLFAAEDDITAAATTTRNNTDADMLELLLEEPPNTSAPEAKRAKMN